MFTYHVTKHVMTDNQYVSTQLRQWVFDCLCIITPNTISIASCFL